MMNFESEKILIVDGMDQHLDQKNSMLIHPKKLNLVNTLEKNSFDQVIIKNTVVDDLTPLSFFNLSLALKDIGSLEVIVYQPISVLQEVDANEIEAKARLGGFTDIKREPFKTWEKIGNKDFCLITIKMIMIKAVKK